MMSSIYRYIVFAPKKQPTVREMDELDEYCEASKLRYAAGINAADGGLALAFDAREFEAARSTNGEFARLLDRWAVRGSTVRPKLLFIKRPDALQPIPGDFVHEPVELRGEKLIQRKKNAAHDAIAAASLKLQRTLERHAWLQRMANVMPYALMGLAAVLTIASGYYAYERLSNRPGESREQTIQRVASDAMEEELAPRTVEVKVTSDEGLEDE